ncbi:MAG: glycoside hydrolase family 15 protein [Pseudobdellovibrionaceae bacterium]
MKFFFRFFVIFFVTSGAWASEADPVLSIYREPLLRPADWLQKEAELAQSKLNQNISPAGTVAGVVIASPQKENPNYFRHWVRDAALTMDVVLRLWQQAPNQGQRALWEKHLKDFTFFSRQNQLTTSITGLGEPIFEVNGHVFQGPWGRPQNDGPALRAAVLSDWAQMLLDQGDSQFVNAWLYSSGLPAQTVIKADLEYVSHHWRESSFDLWEEVRGDHFYTRMVQRRALLAGARLAQRLHDEAAARWYYEQASELEQEISKHWNPDTQQIDVTLRWKEGVNYKNSALDAAVLLGVLHGEWDSFYTVGNSQVQSTFERMVSRFASLYRINSHYENLGPALGRYPEDLYGGTHFNAGNPWVLTTLAAAEYCYKQAERWAGQDRQKTQRWLKRGDQFVQRVQFHSYPDGSLSEQINRETGFMNSAADLTWNYSAVLTAHWARKLTLDKIKFIENKGEQP